MGQKFLNWRQNDNNSGPITVPEVVRFSQALILETKQIIEEELKKKK